MSKFKILRWIRKFIPLPACKNIIEFFKHYIGGLLERLDSHHVFLSGGGIAYSLLLSMIPILLLIISVFGNLVEISWIENQVNTFINAVIPHRASAAYIKQFILSRIPEVIQFKTLAGYTGALGLFFTATWLFSSLRTVLNRIFGVTYHISAWIGLLRDFGMVLLLILFILLSTLILPVINILVDSADQLEILKMFRISDLFELLLSFVTILIIFWLFFSFYYLIPYEKLGKRVPLISAFWATILWELARFIFVYYVRNFLMTNKVYGAFVLITVIVFWIFYSSIVFVIGAEIGQLYRERRQKAGNI
ncbi:MAG: YihY/virulence factor BrkB family protein [Bacteroidetes bacterium]|nr:YihY/virulence factor BrkB family protein [Bacteroidota bacterium]